MRKSLKRPIMIFAAMILFCGLLFACKLRVTEPPTEATPSGTMEKAPETAPPDTPEGNGAWRLRFPEFLTEEVENSAAYRTAVERKAVIEVYPEIITDSAVVYDFLEKAEAGEACELYLYTFTTVYEPPVDYAYVRRFYQSEGEMYYQIGGGPVTGGIAFENDSLLDSFYLDPFGVFVYSGEMASMTLGDRVISYREQYPDMGERLRLRDTYIAPQQMLVGMEWSGGADVVSLLGSRLFWLFEDLYFWKTGSLWEHFPTNEDGWVIVPMSEVEAVLGKYFDGITREDIVAPVDYGYDAELDAFVYMGGRGGVDPGVFVTAYGKEGDLLTIDYCLLDIDTGVPTPGADRRLVVRLLEGEAYRYVSGGAAE